jgi:hypothetical protein
MQWPGTLIVSNELTAASLVAETGRLGIGIHRASKERLQLLIGEARQAFAEYFKGGSAGVELIRLYQG